MTERRASQRQPVDRDPELGAGMRRRPTTATASTSLGRTRVSIRFPEPRSRPSPSRSTSDVPVARRRGLRPRDPGLALRHGERRAEPAILRRFLARLDRLSRRVTGAPSPTTRSTTRRRAPWAPEQVLVSTASPRRSRPSRPRTASCTSSGPMAAPDGMPLTEALRPRVGVDGRPTGGLQLGRVVPY